MSRRTSIGIRYAWLGALAAILLAVMASEASAFSSFKGRFGGMHPICRLEPGTQIWPLSDIEVAPPRATSAASCPAAAVVSQCKTLNKSAPQYGAMACDAILKKEKNCKGAAPANLGNRSDKQYWAGYSPYKYVQRTSHEKLGKLGEIEVPVDIRVRVHVITEADPYYSFVYPAFRIGSHFFNAPPVKAETRKTKWGAYVPQHYWGGWYEDCLCHNPHRYTRGPLNYWFGDDMTPRAAEAMVLEAGTHAIEGSWKCPNRGGDECRSQRVYQQRLRIEFLACE